MLKEYSPLKLTAVTMAIGAVPLVVVGVPTLGTQNWAAISVNAWLGLGFSAFLANYPNSDLAPNARYWLGESQYGKKEYKEAINSYDRVELDYPRSEKVPAALLKKGYAYLALKDKKRASSAFKQVVTLYPKTPEAGKASDKLSQMTKESR